MQDLAAELYRLTCCWLMHRYDEVWRLRFETITMSGDVKIQYFGIDQFIRCIEQS